MQKVRPTNPMVRMSSVKFSKQPDHYPGWIKTLPSSPDFVDLKSGPGQFGPMLTAIGDFDNLDIVSI